MKHLLLFAFLLTVPAPAANDDWARVQGIAAGTKVRVDTPAGRREGAFVSSAADGITLRRGDKPEETIPRTGIRRVKAAQGSNLLRNTIIGSAIGLAAGAIVYGSLGSLLENEGAEGAIVLLFLPTGAGALLGAALPARRMVTVYEAPRP